VGDPGLTDKGTYEYMAHPREIPAQYEVPMEQVWAVALAFLEWGSSHHEVSNYSTLSSNIL
jgi:hypothetical protein